MLPVTKLDEGMIIYISFNLLSAVVQSMSAPTTESSPFYAFLYRFLSLIISDYKSFAQKPTTVAPKTTPSTGTTV